MYCGNCGMPLKDDETVCPSCNTPTGNVVESKIIDDTTASSTKYEEYKETERLCEKYSFTKLLIFSILELFCCSKLFGIICLILLFVQLKPSIDKRNFTEAEKAKKLIETLLIVGLVLGILCSIGYIAIQFLPLLGLVIY